MKKLLYLLLVVVFSCSASVDVQNEKIEVEKVLERWRQGVENLDANSIAELFDLDDTMINWGGGADERYVGWESYGNHVEHASRVISKQVVKVKELQIRLSKSGNVAWFNQVRDYRGTFTSGAEARLDDVRVTGVLEKREGKWIIVHFHHSIGLSGKLPDK